MSQIASYHGDAYISQAGDSIAGAISKYFQDRDESQGLDTALQTLGAAHANDQDFQQKFVPILAKAGGMSLSQKRNVAGQIAGYMGQRFHEQQAAQTAKWQQAQMDNMTADNKRADEIHRDAMEANQATGDATNAWLENPLDETGTGRIATALAAARVSPKNSARVAQTLYGLEPKPATPGRGGLPIGETRDLGDGQTIVGMGENFPPKIIGPQANQWMTNPGKGFAITDKDGNVLNDVALVQVSNGSFQVLPTRGKAPPEEFQVDGVTVIRQPNGNYLPIHKRATSLLDVLNPGGETNAPAGAISSADYFKLHPPVKK